MNIGKNIALMRKNRRMSQEDLANKIGIHRVALSNIERGETSVSFDRVLKICECLNTSIDDLIHADELSQSESKLHDLDPTMTSAINDITQSFQLQIQQLYKNKLQEVVPVCTRKAIGTTVRKLSFDVGYIMNFGKCAIKLCCTVKANCASCT